MPDEREIARYEIDASQAQAELEKLMRMDAELKAQQAKSTAPADVNVLLGGAPTEKLHAEALTEEAAAAAQTATGIGQLVRSKQQLAAGRLHLNRAIIANTHPAKVAESGRGADLDWPGYVWAFDPAADPASRELEALRVEFLAWAVLREWGWPARLAEAPPEPTAGPLFDPMPSGGIDVQPDAPGPLAAVPGPMLQPAATLAAPTRPVADTLWDVSVVDRRPVRRVRRRRTNNARPPFAGRSNGR